MGKILLESPLVHTLFKCHLCNGLIRSATVINECLHRFCKICITKHFENLNETRCPICHETVAQPLESLKSDPIFQRLLYKLFPSVFQHEINYKPSLLSSAQANESPRIHLDSTIDVQLEFWDLSSDLFPNSHSSSVTLSPCYLECAASTPLKLIEKFIRLRYSLGAELQIDLFYQRFLLNKEEERLIDICYCFDQLSKHEILHLRFLVSPFGYETILKRIRQSRQPLPTETAPPPPTTNKPLEIEITEESSRTDHPDPSVSPSASSSDSTSFDQKLKVKIRRSQTSTNDWYIPQSKSAESQVTIVAPAQTNSSIEPVGLPDLVHSCKAIEKIEKRKVDATASSSTTTTPKKKFCPTSTFFSASQIKARGKPRRRTRFIPTMVPAPPSIFDRSTIDRYEYSDQDSDPSPICPQSTVTTMRPAEMVIVNVEGNVADPFETRKAASKTICKVPPYIPEISTINHSPPEKPSTVHLDPTVSPIRRTLLQKRIPSLISPLTSERVTTSSETPESAPLDLSLK